MSVAALPEDPWAAAAENDRLDGQEGDGRAGHDGGVGQELPPYDDNVVDVHAAEAKPRKRSRAVLAGLALVGLGVIGGTGMMLYSLYTKLFPSSRAQQVVQQADAGAIDTAATAPPASPAPTPAAPTADAPGLGAGRTAGAVYPAGSASSGEPSQPGPAQPVGPATPVEQAAAPAPAPAQAVAPAERPASAPAVSPVAAPVASVKPPAAKTGAAAPAAPSTAPAAAGPGPSQAVARSRHRPRAAVSKPVQQAGVESPVAARATPDARAQKPSHPVAPRKATGTATAAKPSPQNAAALDVLNQYRVMSIWPRSGDFQQAWVRDPKGRIHVLQAGDSIEGTTVVSVDFKQYVVRTAQGQIR
jgi:hypothetical protein